MNWTDAMSAASPAVSEVPVAELESYLRGLFSAADISRNGVLQPAEMAKLLQSSVFNISAGAILEAVAKADVNQDGVIEYDEFVPAAASVLRSYLSTPAVPQSPYRWDDLPEEECTQYLQQLFAIADQNQDGVVQPQEFVELMKLSGLGFPDELILQVTVMIG